MPILYRGSRRDDGTICVLRVNDTDNQIQELTPAASLKAWNHSPTGFEWGYSGSGPAQLAVALLLDVTGSVAVASRLHQAFKWAFVANWPKAGFRVTQADIVKWVNAQPFPKDLDYLADEK